MTKEQEQYTEIEKDAQKWLDETDTMQFSQMELLTMFAAHRKRKEVNQEQPTETVSNRFDDEKFITNCCFSYNHNYGLIFEKDQKKLRFECSEWMRAIKNNEPIK